LTEGLLVNKIFLAADADTGAALTSLLVPLVLVVLIFYFLVFRPQQQQRQKVQDLLAGLKTGDRVLTSGGIYGTIVGFRNGVVQLQVANQVRIDVARSAISALASEGTGDEHETSTGRDAQVIEKGPAKARK
jgi:preprotein translocase subunit YajC